MEVDTARVNERVCVGEVGERRCVCVRERERKRGREKPKRDFFNVYAKGYTEFIYTA